MSSDLPVLLAAVSVLSGLHMGFQSRRVGWSRIKHKILQPSVVGPAEFERTFRAHQNGVEFYPIFLVLLWTSGIFCNEGLSAFGGLLYIVGREMYFTGYISETKKRLPGFYLGLFVILVLSVMASVGIIKSFLDKYLKIEMFERK
ncbi:microsomal glutathione S-transferase 2 [Xyrauchen texanus]|uniref:microsomal glutathione S-transferase 2 n=1 Tax=Xyrauchen texanus TaxID=154827 RepID=UPI0022424CDE|nr:microsomal glutathione S-transferase 2 [Xyrauchen texanus]